MDSISTSYLVVEEDGELEPEAEGTLLVLIVHGNLRLHRGGLVLKAHRLLYHSTLGLRVIKKKKTCACSAENAPNVRKRLQG